MKHRFILLILLLSLFHFTKAQTGVYKTYDDFIKGNLDKMDDDYVDEGGTNYGITIKFKLDGQTVKYKPKNIWGFLYKGNLFRTVDNDFVCVCDTGKVCFYENGGAHLYMIRHNSLSGWVTSGYYSYMSAGINEKIYRMPFSDSDGDIIIGNQKQYKEFMDKYPEHQKLYDCIDKTTNYKKIRKCVEDYNKGN